MDKKDPKKNPAHPEEKKSQGNKAIENEAAGKPSLNFYVLEETSELLSSQDIIKSIKSFKADTEEKEIALEFVNYHIQFLTTIVEIDRRRKFSRSDVEIQDLVSHVNMLLSKKDEYLFTSVAINSPAHYKSILQDLIRNDKKVKDTSDDV